MSPIISADELKTLIATQSILLLDCRYDLADTRAGKDAYLNGHLPGALYVSLDDDLCATLGAHGGRHPLPSVEAMTALFGRLGIVRGKTQVVAYDDQGGCFAARLWWMLRYCGHEAVRVLDGGFSAWLAARGENSKRVPENEYHEFLPDILGHMLATVSDVRARSASEILVDCRAAERFSGEEENLDAVAGHIPGAFNVYWKEMLTPQESFRPIARMADLLTGVGESSILYCGSGVTACVNVLAAECVGLGTPRLYPGSWSDWITYPENAIATGV
jgi:thiosulfate/3-mercaptopyruvate sulfurtransferase